jgi:hypothetical protein
MADSLIATISRLLTPDIIGKMAAAAGMDSATAQTAASAAVPAILGGFANLASKPGGARQLADAVAEQPAGLLASLASAMSGGVRLQEQGSNTLASLLGGGTLGSLVSAVSRFAGIGEGSVRSLMGMLAPVILGVLGREQRASGLDASGLARMLADQKDQIAAALPPGLSGIFNTREAPEAFTGPSSSRTRVQDEPAAAYSLHRVAGTTTGQATSDARKTSGSSWAYWALPLLALAGLAWYLLPNETPDRTATSTASRPSAVQLLPTAGDKSVYLATPGEGWISVATYINQEIQNRDGERIGIVKDLLVGPDGKVNAAVIGVGRFLGIGEKDIAVPLAVLQMQRRENGRLITMDVAKEFLRTVPSFEQVSTGTSR